jgi:uncharacterized membrane protein
MDFLNRLLTPDAPPGATLRSAEWTLRGPVPAWAAGLILIGLGVAAVWFYRRESTKLTLVYRFALVGLRIALLGLLLCLVLRPVLTAEFAGERPRGVAVLFDNSQSMNQQDRRVTPRDKLRALQALGMAPFDATIDAPEWASAARESNENPARAAMVKAVIENSGLDLMGRLGRIGPMRSYLFGQWLRGAASGKALAITVDDPRTALGDAIGEVLLKLDGDPPAAIVVISDGLENASKLPFEEAARECQRLGVPVHIWGVGSSESGILTLRDAAIPDTLFYDDTVTIPISFRARGFKPGTKVVTTVSVGGKVVTTKEAAIADENWKSETLTFTPQRGGSGRETKKGDVQADMVISVRSKNDPSFVDEIKRTVQIVDRRVKVLMIDGSPRWEFKFLMPALLRDRRVEATFWLADGDERLQKSAPFIAEFPPRDRLFGYDLIILGDVPSGALGPERQQWLQDYVREGGGLVVIAGRNHMPAAYDATPLDEVLPIEFIPVQFADDPTARPVPFRPEMTPAGERSEILSLADVADENRKIWKGLPGFYWHYPATKLRPGATTLLAHPTLKLSDGPMPVMAMQYYGKGQVLFAATDESWRWRFDDEEKLYARFWGQVIYRLGLPHLMGNARRVQMALERGEAVLGRPGYVYARLLDADFKPLMAERVTATMQRLEGESGREPKTSVNFDAVPGRPGEYRTFLGHEKPGRYEIKVTKPEAATFAFQVRLPPQHELEPGLMAEQSLRELAAATGGRFYHEEDLPTLAASIEPKSAAFVQRREVLFWNPLAFVLFVLLITAEWVMRKFANLT